MVGFARTQYGIHVQANGNLVGRFSRKMAYDQLLFLALSACPGVITKRAR